MRRNAQPKRKPALVLGALLSIVALLAIAAPASAHRHGSSSDDPAGTVASFDKDTGMLSIDLAAGGSVSGLVTDDTWIGRSGRCDHGQGGGDRRSLLRHERRRHRHHGGDHGWHHGWSSGGTDDLTPGAVVDDAVLVLEGGKAVFVKVELAPPASS